jgi:hypothetical protein
MTTTLPPNGKKQALTIIKWIVGVLISLFSLGAFSSSFLAGLLVLIAGLVVIPVISEKLKNKTSCLGEKVCKNHCTDTPLFYWNDSCWK